MHVPLHCSLTHRSEEGRAVLIKSVHWVSSSTCKVLDCICSAEAGPVLLRTEALSALCGLAKNYTACLISHWAMVSQAVAHNLKAGRMRSGGSSSQPGTPSKASVVHELLLQDAVGSVLS